MVRKNSIEGDGENGDGETGRWGDREMGRQGDGETGDTDVCSPRLPVSPSPRLPLKRRQAKRAIELAIEFVVFPQSHFHDAGQFFEIGDVHDCVDVV